MSGHRSFKDDLLGHETGASDLLDPGDGGRITATADRQTVSLVTGGAETRLLTDPSGPGQMLMIFMKTDGGDGVITADTQINQAGNTIMTFADAGDHINLIGIKEGTSLEWRVMANDGVALS